MTTFRYTSKKTLRLTFLALLTVTTLLMPLGAQAAERDGTVLFFPLQDIQYVLAYPSLSSLSSLFSVSSPASGFAWREQSGAAEQASQRERKALYGTGLEIEGYRLPGPRPLWGD